LDDTEMIQFPAGETDSDLLQCPDRLRIPTIHYSAGTKRLLFWEKLAGG